MLYFDENLSNPPGQPCAFCHHSTSADRTLPVFTDHSYDNLGKPKNPEIEKLLGEEPEIDLG